MLQDCSHCGGKNQHVIIKNTTWNVLIYSWRQIRTSGMTFVIKHDTLHKLETAYADEHVTGTYSHAKMHLWFRCLKPKISLLLLLLLYYGNSTCTKVIFKWKNIKLYLVWSAKSRQSILLSFYIYIFENFMWKLDLQILVYVCHAWLQGKIVADSGIISSASRHSRN